MGISVSEVAAVLNVLLMFIQYTLPLFVALIAVAIVENTNNAATWSVFGQLINSTKWPSLLRTDSASKRRVSKRIIYLSLVATVASVLMTVTSAIAPLGLHNDSYATSPEPVPFSYVRDDSPIGKVTASQGSYNISRQCGFWVNLNCPGSYGGYISYSNKSGYSMEPAPGVKHPYVDTSVASNITNVFTSATRDPGNTLSSIFDIHYRSFYNYGQPTEPSGNATAVWYDQGRPRTMGVPRFYNSMIMDNKIEAVEGLVVDMVNGGVGFRNHTLPPTSPYGTTWSEDLLWLEPDVVCVNLNITLDYTISPPDASNEVNGINPRLTDRGGIVYADGDNVPDINFDVGQSDPQLYQRAYLGALGTLSNILKGLKVVNAPRKLGTTYKLNKNYLQYTPDRVTFAQFTSSETSFTMPEPIEVVDPLASFNSSPKYFNAWLMTQGYGDADYVDINRIHSSTGLMLGAGIQVDANGDPLQNTGEVPNIAPMTHWSQQLFSCVSAVKASVKTVSFRMEGEALVSNLAVEQVTPRKYGAGEDLPTWAMERTRMMINDFNPYWGIVSSRYASSPNLQTIKSDHFYLPATSMSVDILGGAMVALWTGANDGTTSGGVPDYSGQSSFPMFQKWSSLSRNASTVGNIISRMWTDLMANAAVGVKGLLSNDGDSSAATADHIAVVYEQGVQYHWLYGIPGFFLILLWLLLLTMASILFCTRRISIGLLRYMLNQTSAGRAITAERYGHREENAAPTRYWADTIGSEQVRVIKQVPQSSLGYEDAENIEMIRHIPKAN